MNILLPAIEKFLGQIIGICAYLILIIVALSFIIFSGQKEKKKKITLVDTFTMLIFVLIFTIVVRKNIGDFILRSDNLTLWLMFIGIAIVVFSAGFNIYGRIFLGNNWSNQIRIYKKHDLVTSGAYKIVRHPLYASLIWLFFGVSLVYRNYLSVIMNLVIFIPMMYFRAKQEEKLLEKTFKNYKEYKNNVGMFFPKMKKLKDYFEKNSFFVILKLLTALFLFLFFFRRNQIFGVIGFAIGLISFLLAYVNYNKINVKNKFLKALKNKLESQVISKDIGELKFTMGLGLLVLIIAFYQINLSHINVGYYLVLFVGIMKTLSGLGFCAGIYLYKIFQYCPICGVRRKIMKEDSCKVS